MSEIISRLKLHFFVLQNKSILFEKLLISGWVGPNAFESVCVSVCPNLCVQISIEVSVRISVQVSIYLSVCPFVRFSVSVSVCFSVLSNIYLIANISGLCSLVV